MIFKSYLAEKDNTFISKNNVVLFYGENLGLKNNFRKKITQLKNVKIIRNSQEEVLKEKNNFFDNLLNNSLFNETNVFIIDNVNDKFLDFFQSIESRLNDNKIFLFADLLDKKSKIRVYFEKSKKSLTIPCYQDDVASIKKLIHSELKSFTINNECIDIITDNCNLDRDKLYNELEKIKVYFLDLKIDEKKLKILLNLKTNDNFFKIRDEVLNGNKTKVNKLLNETILEKDKNIYYLNVINQRLSKIAEALNNDKKKTVETIVENMRPPIFWKDKPNLINQIKKWNKIKIRKILEDSYKLELRLKSDSSINHNLMMKMFMVNICNIANS